MTLLVTPDRVSELTEIKLVSRYVPIAETIDDLMQQNTSICAPNYNIALRLAESYENGIPELSRLLYRCEKFIYDRLYGGDSASGFMSVTLISSHSLRGIMS